MTSASASVREPAALLHELFPALQPLLARGHVRRDAAGGLAAQHRGGARLRERSEPLDLVGREAIFGAQRAPVPVRTAR